MISRYAEWKNNRTQADDVRTFFKENFNEFDIIEIMEELLSEVISMGYAIGELSYKLQESEKQRKAVRK